MIKKKKKTTGSHFPPNKLSAFHLWGPWSLMAILLGIVSYLPPIKYLAVVLGLIKRCFLQETFLY